MTIYQEFHLMLAYLRDAERFNAAIPPGCVPADASWFQANAIGFASR
jgi:hypothetical protein